MAFPTNLPTDNNNGTSIIAALNAVYTAVTGITPATGYALETTQLLNKGLLTDIKTNTYSSVASLSEAELVRLVFASLNNGGTSAIDSLYNTYLNTIAGNLTETNISSTGADQLSTDVSAWYAANPGKKVVFKTTVYDGTEYTTYITYR